MKKKILAILLTVCMVLSMAPTALATNHVFADMNADDWFSEAVKYVYDNGFMNGVGDNMFDPDGTVTRSMVWTTLARLDGVDTTGSDPWWLAGQQWAMENEISDGTNPDNNITREQLVTMIWRYAKYIGVDVSVDEDADILSYTDAHDVSDWAVDAMQWACAGGVINGIDGTLEPQGEAVRNQLAVVLYRFEEEVVEEKPAPAPVPTPVPVPDSSGHECVIATSVVTPPTCTERGYTTYTTCCGSTYTGNYVNALDHAWSAWVDNDNGTHTRTCGNNGEHIETSDCGFGSWTENGDGTHTGQCGDCVYVVSADCNFGSYISNDDGTHQSACADCGYVKTETCSVVIPAEGTPACAHCGFADVIVVDSIAALSTAITQTENNNRVNDGKVIVLKKGNYSMTSRFDIHNISVSVIGEKNSDGTNGVKITQTGNAHVFHIEGTLEPNPDPNAPRKHVILGNMDLDGGKAGVENRGHVLTDLYDMHITNTSWNAISLDICSDDVDGIKVTVNAHHVTTGGKRAQVNAHPKQTLGTLQYFNYAEFNFDADCSDSFKTNNGFANVEDNIVGKNNILINGQYYQPANWTIDVDGNVEILTATGLKEFSAAYSKLSDLLVGKTVTLMNDIALTGSFTPIGTAEKPFKGTFNGNGKTITGLTAGGDAATNAGLFGVLSGTVQNLTVSGAEVSGTANVGVIAGTVNAGAAVTDCTVTDSAVICTSTENDASFDSCKAGKIAGNIPAEFDLSSNTAGDDVLLLMASVYDTATNTYSIATPTALSAALASAATVDTKAPVIKLVYGKYDAILIPNNTNGNDPRLVGLTLQGSDRAIVGHLNLNGTDNVTLDGVTFDAGKAGSGLSGQYENIFSGVTASMTHSCVGLVVQNCTFTGTYQTHPYNCIRFPEKTTSSNNTRGRDVTIQKCKFLCNAQQYIRLDYVYGNVNILNNTFGGSGFGSSHNNINATNNYANWTVTGNSFNNWQYTYSGSVNDGTAYAFGSSRGTDPITFTFTGNSFNNASGDVIWLKNYNDETHEAICIENNTYSGGLTQTDADAIFRKTG